MTLTLSPLPDIPMIQPGDDLPEIIISSVAKAGLSLVDGDILVLAQKIVSKSEGRLVNLSTISPSQSAYLLAEKVHKDIRLLELILRESNEVLRTRGEVIIVEHRLGFVCANAGIDHSNVKGESFDGSDWVLLLPEDPDESALRLRDRLESMSGAHIGVLIIDSHGRAWRLGTVGMAIGLSGMPGVVDLRGQPDLFDFRLQVTQVGVADELAAAASLVMGQAAEGTPVVHVRGFPYPLRDGCLQELLRPKDLDLFR
jgi:coenzyme F420-0:L-glutamate ligase/coenzyme F420-1:gamma-L-glutamate ligase